MKREAEVPILHSCPIVGRLSHQPHLLFRTGFVFSKMKDPRQKPKTPSLSLLSWNAFCDPSAERCATDSGEQNLISTPGKELFIIEWREQAQRGEITCRLEGSFSSSLWTKVREDQRRGAQVQHKKGKSGEFQSGDAIWLAGCRIQLKEEAHSFTNSELPNSLPAGTPPPPGSSLPSSSYGARLSQVASVWLP